MQNKLNNKRVGIISLAIPIAVETLLRNLINTLNVYLLAGYSDSASTGVGVANQVNNIVLMFCTAVATGAAVVVSRERGAQNGDGASRAGMNAISLGFLIGAVASTLLVFMAEPTLRMLGLEEELIGYGAAYLRITGGAAFLMTTSQILTAIFRAYGNSRIPMLVITFVNILSLAGTYASINFPEAIPCGVIEGVAWSKFICEGIGVALLLLLMIKLGYGFRLKYAFKLDMAHIRGIVSVGMSSCAESLSYNFGTLLTTGFIAASAASSLALSAKVYVGSVNFYEQIIGMSLGQSAQILTGQLIGAGRLQEAQAKITGIWKYVAMSNLLSSIMLFIFRKQLIGLFTDDERIIAIASPLFLIEIFINVARSFNHSFNFGNRSAGYVLYPAIVAVVSLWSIYVGLGYLLCNVAGLGITGIWIAMFIDESTRGTATATMWLKRKWMKRFAREQTE